MMCDGDTTWALLCAISCSGVIGPDEVEIVAREELVGFCGRQGRGGFSFSISGQTPLDRQHFYGQLPCTDSHGLGRGAAVTAHHSSVPSQYHLEGRVEEAMEE